jgi:hypothetical protein
LFAGTNGEGIFRSTTGGNYWVQKNNGLTSLNISDIVRDSARLICGTNPEGVFHSTDNGGSWTKLDNGLTGYIRALKISGNTLFAGTGNGVFRTSLDVNLWVAANNGLPNPSFCLINEFGLKDTILFTSVSGSGIFRSFDNGDTWAQCNDGLSSNDASSFASFGDLVFTGTGSGVFYSTDNGDNWHSFNDGLGDLRITSLAIHEEYLFAGTTTSSIWRRLISDIITGVAVKESFQVKVFPNPVTDLISFQYPFKSKKTNYTIYDLTGKIIQNGTLEKSPIFQIKTEGINDGIYLIRLYDNFESVTTKFIKI